MGSKVNSAPFSSISGYWTVRVGQDEPFSDSESELSRPEIVL